MQRPFGLTLLAILALIFGILVAIAGILFVRVGVVATAAVPAIPMVFNIHASGFGAIALGLGLILVGVLSVAFALGAFRGASWSWIFGVVGQLVNLVVSIVQLVIGIAQGDVTNAIISNALSIVVALIILIYINRPTARAYFRSAVLVRSRV